MFNKTAPVTEPAPVVTEQADTGQYHLIPLSHLELDLPAPSVGWLIELDRRGIAVVDDDIGRKSISRADARLLLDEQREAEARVREVLERREQQLIQQDRLRWANLPTGIPAGMVPDGLRPAEAMMLAGESSAPRAKSVREQLLEREFAHSGHAPGYQSIGPDEG